ncbi:MAG: hypothetical protein Kow0010_24660 [Dehalococcoidia bacterium]
MSYRVDAIQHFLLVFDHDAGQLVEMLEFGNDAESALAAYAKKEREIQEDGGALQKRRRVEIVLIGSDSIDTVRRTHANYFGGQATSKYFDFAFP